MPFSFLLALQASGMVIDFFGSLTQKRLGDMAYKIQQQGIEANIYQTRLETEDASLQAMQQLRKNMGTQMAVMAARGTSTAAGSALAISNEGLSNFNTDERMRRLNQLGRENELRAGGSIAKLNQSAQNSKLWQSFASRTLNRFPTSPYGFGGKSSNPNRSFGLTPIGG
jgi:hypothetical protein